MSKKPQNANAAKEFYRSVERDPNLPIIRIDGEQQEFTAYKIDLRGKHALLGWGIQVVATITLWRGDPGEVVEVAVSEDEDGNPTHFVREGWSGERKDIYTGGLAHFPPRRENGKLVYELLTEIDLEGAAR